MGNPVQTCSDSGQPFVDLPEHPAYHRSFHRPGPAGHGALPSPTPPGYRKPLEGAAASASAPRRSADRPRAVSQMRESSFHPGHPMGEQAGCDRTQEGGRKPAPTQAASWQGCSDLSSSQEPQGVVRQKVASKHLQGPAASGLRALTSGPEGGRTMGLFTIWGK